MRTLLAVMLGTLVLSGCNESTAPRDHTPPAAPRGVRSVTGDHQVFLSWLPNTEADVREYRVYVGDCAGGASCPYDPIGSTQSANFVVSGLTNGQTRYYAVSAVDANGNESELSYDDVFDTPRPEGTGLQISNYLADSLHAGYDFSDFAVKPYRDSTIDIVYYSDNGQSLMFAPFSDTDIQDAGYTLSLDAVDYAPPSGWSPTGSVELIQGHSYVVLTGDDHYAKFRVTSLNPTFVTVDWAYQTAAGNRELKSRPVTSGPRRARPIPWASAAGHIAGGA
jgi:hypothetical protein